jgi:hypothetical protein
MTCGSFRREFGGLASCGQLARIVAADLMLFKRSFPQARTATCTEVQVREMLKIPSLDFFSSQRQGSGSRRAP